MARVQPRGRSLAAAAARCCWRSVSLLTQGRLHIPNTLVGHVLVLQDRRRFHVFRDTTRDGCDDDVPAVLTVWFQLRAVPPSARVRSALFERESLLNTMLYAGFPGYRRKLWMVERSSATYAGLYAWRGHDSAQVYATYITRVLAPFCRAGSVGYALMPGVSFDEYVAAHDVAAAPPGAAGGGLPPQQ